MGIIVSTIYVLMPFMIGTASWYANLHTFSLAHASWSTHVALAAHPFVSLAPITVPLMALAIWAGRRRRK